ncbi:MAG: sortase [Actinomycetes bacterium]
MSLVDQAADPVDADRTDPSERPEHEAPVEGGRRARSAVVAAVLAVLALWAIDVYLVPAAGRVRQEHRLQEYQEPARRVRVGDPALLLQVPALRMDQVVVKGATPALLQGGPGWREGSAPPGTGNTVLLGRSTRWTYPFAQLSKLPKGASVFLRTRDGRVYKYQVRSVRRLRSGLTSVMDPTGRNRLTLVTSAGGPFDTSRTVVVATGVGTPVPTPKEFREPVRKLTDLGPFDERGPGGLLLLLAGFVVVGLGVLGVLEMRGRYSTFTVAVVAGPALALGVVLVLFHLDAFLPITY